VVEVARSGDDIPSEQLAGLLAANSPEAGELGLYVHVPFCAKRCGYCSFNTAPLEDGAMARYLGAVRREIALLGALPWASRIRLGTIFFLRWGNSVAHGGR